MDIRARNDSIRKPTPGRSEDAHLRDRQYCHNENSRRAATTRTSSTTRAARCGQGSLDPQHGQSSSCGGRDLIMILPRRDWGKERTLGDW